MNAASQRRIDCHVNDGDVVVEFRDCGRLLIRLSPQERERIVDALRTIRHVFEAVEVRVALEKLP